VNINNSLLWIAHQKIARIVEVNAMSRPLADHRDHKQGRTEDGIEDILEFLVRELPPGRAKQAPYLAAALRSAGARYDRYAEKRKECLDYTARRYRLFEITKAARELASNLCHLDILSRDELARRIDPAEVETLVGSLLFLSRETADLAEEVQKNGRPRDLAEERWIMELADIYENAFSKPASVWGSGDEPEKRRGKFYSLLEVSRPASFPRLGKLSVKQVDRTLKLRRQRSAPADLQTILLQMARQR
jgi:hypothetical protein